MSKQQLQDDETLLLIYRARLERLNDEKVEVVFDPDGPFQIMQPPTGTLVRYFTPERQEGIDPFGNDTTKQLNQ